MQRSLDLSGLPRLATFLLVTLCLAGAWPAAAADLQGRWVGYWDCGSRETRSHFVLDIAGNSAHFQTPIGIATVAGTASGDGIDLKVEQWETRAPSPQKTVTGIAGAYLDTAGAMTGEVQATGQLQCKQASQDSSSPSVAQSSWTQTSPRFIAVKTGSVPQPRENSNGLLFKVTDDVRSGRELPPAECARYAGFLQAGESGPSPISRRTKLSSQVLNDELMLDVLGRDLNSWTQADFKRMRAISSSCKQVMLKSKDPAFVQQARAIRAWKPKPLDQDRSAPNGQRSWVVAIASLYVDAIEPLPGIAMRIDEGLYDDVPDTAATAPAVGLAGLWHGHYQCETREYYMRLDLREEAGQVDGAFEFASGMHTRAARGVLNMRGSEAADGQFQLEPTTWVHQPTNGTTIGFEGLRVGDRLSGRITGSGERCTTFSARRRTVTTLPKNPDGLLFKMVKLNTSQITPADCRRFVNWLVSGRQLVPRVVWANSIASDQGAAKAVLGKSATTWDKDDHRKFMALANFCGAQLRDSTENADRELHAQVIHWHPKPFSTDKFDYTFNDWLMVDQTELVMTEAEEQMTAQFEEIGRLSPELASIDRINEMIIALADSEGRFVFLPPERQVEHRDTLLAEREALGERVAIALAATYSAYPSTFDGFKAMAAESRIQQKELIRRGVEEAAATLKTLYGEEAARRGAALLPVMMAEHRAVMTGELEKAGYGSIPVLFEIDQERESLAEYWLPPKDTPLYAEYQDYLDLRDTTAHNMVTRSKDKLLEWVETLPPSRTANRYFDRFTLKTFRSKRIPPAFPELESAIASKKAAYNPDRYSRPDIMMALLRRQFGEVKYTGLEAVAYQMTILRRVRDNCSTEIGRLGAEGASKLDGYIRVEFKDAIKHIAVKGAESQFEYNRYFSITAHALFGAPGCKINMWGAQTCISEEQASAEFEAIMTSITGLGDHTILHRDGCTGRTRQFMENLLELAKSGAPPSLGLPTAWDFVAGH